MLQQPPKEILLERPLILLMALRFELVWILSGLGAITCAGLLGYQLLSSDVKHIIWKTLPSVSQNMTGKVVLITGASRGMARIIADRFASLGATVVIMDSRVLPEETLYASRKSLKNTELHYINCDFGDLASVEQASHEFKRKFQRLDYLILHPEEDEVVPPLDEFQSFENLWTKHFLSLFVLTRHLMSLAIACSARILITESESCKHIRFQSDTSVMDLIDYADSEICKKWDSTHYVRHVGKALRCFASELSRRFSAQGVTCNFVQSTVIDIHPENFPWSAMAKVKKHYPSMIANNFVYAASEDAKGETGIMFCLSGQVDQIPENKQQTLCSQLWKETTKNTIVGDF